MKTNLLRIFSYLIKITHYCYYCCGHFYVMMFIIHGYLLVVLDDFVHGDFLVVHDVRDVHECDFVFIRF